MKTWTTEMWLEGMPEEILDVLTDPAALARWAPMDFQVLELDGERLQAGSHARVSGGLAGRRLEFDVDVREAHPRRVSVVASGPVSIDAEYLLRPARGGSSVRASVSVSGRGLIGGALARATEALLAAGVLRASVARIGRELEPSLPRWRRERRGHAVTPARRLIGAPDGLDGRGA
jgi:hypothetical protein